MMLSSFFSDFFNRNISKFMYFPCTVFPRTWIAFMWFLIYRVSHCACVPAKAVLRLHSFINQILSITDVWVMWLGEQRCGVGKHMPRRRWCRHFAYVFLVYSCQLISSNEFAHRVWCHVFMRLFHQLLLSFLTNIRSHCMLLDFHQVVASVVRIS